MTLTLGLGRHTQSQCQSQSQSQQHNLRVVSSPKDHKGGQTMDRSRARSRVRSWGFPEKERSKQISMQVGQQIRTPKFPRHKRTAGNNVNGDETGQDSLVHLCFQALFLFFFWFADLVEIMKSATEAICCLLCLQQKKPQRHYTKL